MYISSKVPGDTDVLVSGPDFENPWTGVKILGMKFFL